MVGLLNFSVLIRTFADSKSRHKKKSKHKSSKSSKRSREKLRSREEEEVRKPKREKIEEVSNYSKISLADLWRKNQVMTMFFDRIGDNVSFCVPSHSDELLHVRTWHPAM